MIDLYEKNNYIQPDILPACFNTLSTCYYYEEDIENALKYANKGLESFNESTSKKELKYLLIVNKILYLIALGQRELALELINNVWNHIHEIEPIKVRLNLYKFKSQLLKTAKKYKEAIECAKEGISVARKDKDRNRIFGLLIVLGTIYFELGNDNKAETCFNTVALFEDLKYPRRFVDAHVYLGALKAKQEEWKKQNIIYL
ncbi:hypothetical protein MK805_15540 [Shimazuella sp. AN120528]|uniref:tetratricopeptide repeat protein n=1 Tax=Shimazuella soli TaxID=1892854 RepID=UPI001F0E6D28|nr:hypothetical protein [Shimazuella soli]MCH5586354.1 hypothetical protein [Shimazuella soli]